MTIVNFAIPSSLNKRVSKVIEEKGFASKAEFFRHVTLQYLDVVESTTTLNSNKELGRLADEITKLVIKKFKGRNLPSIEEQLEDM